MRQPFPIVLLALAAWSAGGAGLSAQQIDQVIRSIDGSRMLVRPERVMLSPSGTRLAISDPQANRIYVVDIDAHPVWTVGVGSMVSQPVLLGFEADDIVLYYVKSERKIFRAREANPESQDTVVFDTDSLLGDIGLDRCVALDRAARGFLVLDREDGSLYRMSPTWAVDRKMISQGSGRGRLWSPADLTLDLSGNIVIADAVGCPVQVFTADGQHLFCGSWNQPEPQRQWEASTVGMGPGETIWAADITNLCWRVFDRAGIQIGQYAFEAPLHRPNSIVMTPDRRMFVADDNGAVIVMSLQ